MTTRIRRFAPVLLGAAVMPVVAVAAAPIHGQLTHRALATVIVVGAAAAGMWPAPPRGLAPWLAVIGLGSASMMFLYVSYPGALHVVAAPYGLALGLLAGRPVRHFEFALIALFAAVAAGTYLFEPAIAVAVVILAGVLVAASRPVERLPHRAVGLSVSGLTAVAGLFAVLWVGSTAPGVTWFGSLTSHGPRSSRMVAVTFDDGPNGDYTLEVARILDAHGAKGTFFEVGKAVKLQPEVARALLADGHLVGNHSYHHDATSYLDPRYPELEHAETAIVDATGVCPAFFRPPHGTHTPFMSRVVDNAGMKLVTWDVSARDWVEDDADALARHILAKVKPGSIILLHDGIDGQPGADRSVVLRALPAILDGLQQRGLQPVTLDRLLSVRAYLDTSTCDRFRVSSGYSSTVPSDALSQAKGRPGGTSP